MRLVIFLCLESWLSGGTEPKVPKGIDHSCAWSLAELGNENLWSKKKSLTSFGKKERNLPSPIFYLATRIYISHFLSSASPRACSELCSKVSITDEMLTGSARIKADENFVICNYKMVHAKSFRSFSILYHILSKAEENVISDTRRILLSFKKTLEKKMYEDPDIADCGDTVSQISLLIINKVLAARSKKTLSSMIFGSEISKGLIDCETNVFVMFRDFVANRFISAGTKLRETCTGDVGQSLKTFYAALEKIFEGENSRDEKCNDLLGAMRSVQQSGNIHIN